MEQSRIDSLMWSIHLTIRGNLEWGVAPVPSDVGLWEAIFDLTCPNLCKRIEGETRYEHNAGMRGESKVILIFQQFP